MPILGERFYQMSNAIFCYDLKPIPLAVYSYLVCCAGQKDLCWPSIKTIALHCNCSENAARDAVKQLVNADSSARWQLSRCAATEVGDRVTTTTTSCRCLRFPLRGIVQAGAPPQEMMGKCINKTKDNKDKPVCPCEALCGAGWDPKGPRPLPGISDGFGPVLRFCGGRKKKLDKEPGSLPRLSPGTSARSAGSFKRPRS